jgi:hypothetical protein
MRAIFTFSGAFPHSLSEPDAPQIEVIASSFDEASDKARKLVGDEYSKVEFALKSVVEIKEPRKKGTPNLEALSDMWEPPF